MITMLFNTDVSQIKENIDKYDFVLHALHIAKCMHIITSFDFMKDALFIDMFR